MTSKTNAGGARGLRALNVTLIACAVLAAAGIVLYGIEHAGILSTNLSNLAPWGLYLSCFTMFAGVGAGCLIAAVAPRALGIGGLDAGVERLMGWIGFSALLLAGVFVTIDLGNPLRMLELVVAPHPASPLFWDVVALPVAIALSLVYVFWGHRLRGGAARAYGFVLIAWGVFVLCVDAWIFCSQQAHEAWANSILMPWFVVTGILSGFAVMAIVCAIMRREASTLGHVLAALIAIDLLMYVFDLVCGSAQTTQLTVFGALSPLFWTQFVLYVVAFAQCLAKGAASARKRMIGAGVLVLAGALVKRVTLMIAGFQLPALQLPNASIPYSGGGLVYVPAVSEVACAVGFVGLGLLIVLLGVRFLGIAAADDPRQ